MGSWARFSRVGGIPGADFGCRRVWGPALVYWRNPGFGLWSSANPGFEFRSSGPYRVRISAVGKTWVRRLSIQGHKTAPDGREPNPGFADGREPNPGSHRRQRTEPETCRWTRAEPGSVAGQEPNPRSADGQEPNPGFADGQEPNPGSADGWGHIREGPDGWDATPRFHWRVL